MTTELTRESESRDDLEARSAPQFKTRGFEVFSIAGLPVANLTEVEAVDAIEEMLHSAGSHYVCVVNAAKIVEANRNEALKRALISADFVTADGMSVVWASRVLGRGLKERVTGIDLFQKLIERAAMRGFSVYFLGAREESVRGTIDKLLLRTPALRVAGYRNGYFSESESSDVVEQISRSKTDLLFVAMGSPAQESWIASNLARSGARFALGVGGSFDHVSGAASRAPRWMQKAGLEWLHRLAREPRRLWKRYLIGNFAFLKLVAMQFIRRQKN
jgi:N-acetylglucosaminyldiphosphoundecaprenol N-acetyl-beta-D-mannosaminyltransferase